MRAVILCGGKGTRLKPYTVSLPKPLVPIGGEYPILEIVIKQLINQKFDHITMAVNHMADIIMAFFKDGKKWGVKIDYSIEEKPLSTIGPLTLIEDLPDNFLVMNGDILCNLNYAEFLEHHINCKNEITVSTYKRKSKIDFGVLKFDDSKRIIEFIEKPEYNFDVSMGIYCINKKIIDKLKKGEFYGFDNLMLDSIKNKVKASALPFNGFWVDIGRPEDYDYANDNWPEIKGKLNI